MKRGYPRSAAEGDVAEGHDEDLQEEDDGQDDREVVVGEHALEDVELVGDLARVQDVEDDHHHEDVEAVRVVPRRLQAVRLWPSFIFRQQRDEARSDESPAVSDAHQVVFPRDLIRKELRSSK